MAEATSSAPCCSAKKASTLAGQTAMDGPGSTVPGGILRIWRELGGTNYPAIAGIGVTRLPQKEAMIEIEGVAVIGDPLE